MDSDVRVVCGLGNPGSAYSKTRHNAGLMVLEALSEHLQIPLKAGSGKYVGGQGLYQGVPLLLAFPLTYMNKSGVAAKQIAAGYQSNYRRWLVISDDFMLPLGKLRLRLKGSSGGHNGLQSVIDALETDEFPRLRIGINQGEIPVDPEDFVLSEFEKTEQLILQDSITGARDSVLEWLSCDVDSVMSKYNQVNYGNCDN